MYPLSCKPVAPVPKLANRTPLALVIDSLLVRTANYAVGDRDGSHPMLFDKFKDLAGDAGIVTDVATIPHPGAHLVDLCILGWHDADSGLCRLIQVGAIERNRRNRPTPQSLSGLFSQALEKPIFQHTGLPRDRGSRSILPICGDVGNHFLGCCQSALF